MLTHGMGSTPPPPHHHHLIGVDCIALLLLVPSTDISVNLIGVDCIALLLVVPSTDISVNLTIILHNELHSEVLFFKNIVSF